jgi:hypothetical protein
LENNMTIKNHPFTSDTFDAGADDETVEIEPEFIPPDSPVLQKLADAQTPGYQAEFSPAEAEAAGAFSEDALTEADALASTLDYAYFAARSAPRKA